MGNVVFTQYILFKLLDKNYLQRNKHVTFTGKLFGFLPNRFKSIYKKRFFFALFWIASIFMLQLVKSHCLLRYVFLFHKYHHDSNGKCTRQEILNCWITNTFFRRHLKVAEQKIRQIKFAQNFSFSLCAFFCFLI